MDDIILPDPAKRWALIQTASILEDGELVHFVSAMGDRVPVVLFTSESEHKVRKMKARVLKNMAKVKAFDAVDMLLSVPVLGVVQVIAAKEPKKAEPKATVTNAKPTKARLADRFMPGKRER